MADTRALFRFKAGDFAPMEGHVQTWRFDTNVLPHVRILTAETGRSVHDVLSRYVSTRGYTLSEHHFTGAEECDASRDDAVVASWLRAHDADAAQDVLVSHGYHGVYLVSWGLFCERWSSFCHPASDDVVIAPLSEAWVLLYHHEEVFFWARPTRTVP